MPDFGPALVLLDNKGTVRTTLSVSDAGPLLVRQDKQGVPRNQIGTVQVNVPGVAKAAASEPSIRLADKRRGGGGRAPRKRGQVSCEGVTCKLGRFRDRKSRVLSPIGLDTDKG